MVPRSGVVAYVGVSALFVAAPLERLQPLLTLPGQNITTVEAVMVVSVAAWLLTLLANREFPLLKTPVTRPWVAWLIVAAVAAFAAPAFRMNAVKVAARLAAGLVMLLMTVNGVTTERRLAGVIRLAVISAVAV